jgi:hypothetical protein
MAVFIFYFFFIFLLLTDNYVQSKNQEKQDIYQVVKCSKRIVSFIGSHLGLWKELLREWEKFREVSTRLSGGKVYFASYYKGIE